MIHCSFIVTQVVLVLQFVLLFQYCAGYSESFAIPYGFQSQLVNFYKVITWDTDRDHVESVDPLGESVLT